MNDKVYIHAISGKDHRFINKNQEETLSKILSSRKLLSLTKQGINENPSYAGLDYISLSDYEKRSLYPENHRFYNAYYLFSRNYIGLAFDKENLDTIIPTFIENNDEYIFERKNKKKIDIINERYTDLMDEVQVKDSINLELLSYITYPTSTFIRDNSILSTDKKYEILIDRINRLYGILKSMGYNVDIYDIDTLTKMDNDGIRKLIYKSNC